MCSAFWLQNLKGWYFLGILGVNYSQHDVAEMRYEVTRYVRNWDVQY